MTPAPDARAGLSPLVLPGARPAARPDTRRPNPHTPDGAPATAEWVVAMLEDAGATLLALPQTGHSTRLRQSGLEWARDAAAYPPDRTRLRPAARQRQHPHVAASDVPPRQDAAMTRGAPPRHSWCR